MSDPNYDTFAERAMDRLPVQYATRLDALRAKRAEWLSLVDDETTAREAIRVQSAVRKLDAEIAAEEAREVSP